MTGTNTNIQSLVAQRVLGNHTRSLSAALNRSSSGLRIKRINAGNDDPAGLIAHENTAAADSAIRDADFAAETAALTRAQILVQAGTLTLQMANRSPQNVLTLLG